MNQHVIDTSQWVERYGDVLYRYALLRVKNAELAEELVQITFVAVLQAKDKFAGRSKESTWLIGILKNKIMDHFRQLKRSKVSDLELTDDRDPCESDFSGKGHWQALPIRWGINPQKAIEDKELRRHLATCMDTLSDKFRRLFVLREIEGLESEEICAEFDITPNNLWVMLYRAKNQLKKCLESHLFEGKADA
jgi:RNA polymerase sigma-70 factor (TIGR02943 family)